MRLVVENLTQLLSARYKAKRFARTSSQTMVQAFDNNPLKFAPTAEDALKIMFGPRTRGYLDARRALEGAFGDLKTHQIKTFSAMQRAVKMLVEDLDPDEIGSALGPEKGFAALFGNRKSRLWDMYLARWHAKSLRHEEGLVDAFMLYFAECYDESNDKA
jgi:type VI secretion system protein ImpI